MEACLNEFFNFWTIFVSWLGQMALTNYVTLRSFLVVLAVLSLVIANLVLIAKR